MPVLYETYSQVKPLKRKVKRKSLQTEEIEAYRWRVVEEYAVNAIYLTSEQLIATVKDALNQAAAEKNCRVEWFRVLDVWAVYKGLYTEYHMKYEAVIAGSPIAHATVLLILAICLSIVIAFAIWLVGRYVVEPLVGGIQPAPGWPTLPAGAWIAIFGGLAAIPIGATIYFLKGKPKKPPPPKRK